MKRPTAFIKLSPLPSPSSKLKWMAWIDFDHEDSFGRDKTGAIATCGRTPKGAVERLMKNEKVKLYLKSKESQ